MTQALRSIAGIVFCCTTALVASSLLQDGGELSLCAPILCLMSVIVTASMVGRLAAVLGAGLAALVFEVWLFRPIGSLAVQEPNERAGLAIFLVLSLLVAMIVKPVPLQETRNAPHRRP